MKKYVAALTSGLFTAVIFGTCLFSACTKEQCISEALKAKHQFDKCPTDCPGVVGCDGKKYCNVCEATRVGNSFVKTNNGS